MLQAGGPQSQVTILYDAPDNKLVGHSSVWNLLHVTLLVLTVWRWHLHFWKFVNPCFRLKC